MAGDGSWIIPQVVDCEFPGSCDEPPVGPEGPYDGCVYLYE